MPTLDEAYKDPTTKTEFAKILAKKADCKEQSARSYLNSKLKKTDTSTKVTTKKAAPKKSKAKSSKLKDSDHMADISAADLEAAFKSPIKVKKVNGKVDHDKIAALINSL
jgi:hypothetical protein